MSLEHSEVNENNFLKIVVNLGILGVKHYIFLDLKINVSICSSKFLVFIVFIFCKYSTILVKKINFCDVVVAEYVLLD